MAAAAALTTKRYYSLAGVTVAVRDSAGSGQLSYLLGDQLGSTTTAVNASTGATSTQRLLPYGAPRSGSIGATDRGWIGQTKDTSTGLQYLNARYYDPLIGRFTATDPLSVSALSAGSVHWGLGSGATGP
jgi:RHS repeat-associated protein